MLKQILQYLNSTNIPRNQRVLRIAEFVSRPDDIGIADTTICYLYRDIVAPQIPVKLWFKVTIFSQFQKAKSTVLIKIVLASFVGISLNVSILVHDFSNNTL